MISEYWANGWDDYQDGHDTCPYPEGTAAWQDWMVGWQAAEYAATLR